jgi:hypothetical protein
MHTMAVAPCHKNQLWLRGRGRGFSQSTYVYPQATGNGNSKGDAGLGRALGKPHTHLQLPVHALLVCATEPHRPASQSPVHVAMVSPALEPYRPAGQSEHADAPLPLYCPGWH